MGLIAIGVDFVSLQYTQKNFYEIPIKAYLTELSDTLEKTHLNSYSIKCNPFS